MANTQNRGKNVKNRIVITNMTPQQLEHVRRESQWRGISMAVYIKMLINEAMGGGGVGEGDMKDEGSKENR